MQLVRGGKLGTCSVTKAGEAQGDEPVDQMLRALAGKGWSRGLETKKGLLDLATGK